MMRLLGITLLRRASGPNRMRPECSATPDDGGTQDVRRGTVTRRRPRMTVGSRFAQTVSALAVGLLLVAGVATVGAAQAQAQAPAKKPNILVIMGDDIGWFNIGAYHRGIMSGKTPNLDKLASEGMMFTDYYAEASCTAGRANFITGELPVRTGMTTVGQAGSPIGLPDQAITIATALKSMGYATGQQEAKEQL